MGIMRTDNAEAIREYLGWVTEAYDNEVARDCRRRIDKLAQDEQQEFDERELAWRAHCWVYREALSGICDEVTNSRLELE